LGIDSPGIHHVNLDYPGYSDAENYNEAIGVSGSMEAFVQSKSKKLSYGLGIAAQAPRKVDFDVANAYMGFIPLYGVFRYRPTRYTEIIPEMVGQFGYNFFYGNKAYKGQCRMYGGLYWAIGGALVKGKYVGQFLLQSQHGLARCGEYKQHITNSQFNLSVGMRF
jgi:hypothetical protein